MTGFTNTMKIINYYAIIQYATLWFYLFSRLDQFSENFMIFLLMNILFKLYHTNNFTHELILSKHSPKFYTSHMTHVLSMAIFSQ